MGEDPAEEQKRLRELLNSTRSVVSDFTSTLEIRAVDQNNETFVHVRSSSVMQSNGKVENVLPSCVIMIEVVTANKFMLNLLFSTIKQLCTFKHVFKWTSLILWHNGQIKRF